MSVDYGARRKILSGDYVSLSVSEMRQYTSLLSLRFKVPDSPRIKLLFDTKDIHCISGIKDGRLSVVTIIVCDTMHLIGWYIATRSSLEKMLRDTFPNVKEIYHEYIPKF